MDEPIPLGQGDLHWVFPSLTDAGPVQEALFSADAQVRRLAEHLGVRAGRTGSGLEFNRVEGFVLAGVFGFAAVPDVSFAADLYFPRRCLWDLCWGPPWEVEARITVPCDREVDCGGHTVVERAHSYDLPLDAARGLARDAAWLLAQGTSRPTSAWRSRAEGCPHSPVE
jgi:hypothetical protein